MSSTIKSVVLWTVTLTASVVIPLLMFGLIMVLALQGSDALNSTEPHEAHHFGFWFLIWLSLPFWFLGLWWTTLTTVSKKLARFAVLRRSIWTMAVALPLLGVAAKTNTLGFGDFFFLH